MERATVHVHDPSRRRVGDETRATWARGGTPSA